MVNFFDPPIEFDPEKPFFPLVVVYIAQSHGIIDLFGRGIRARFDALVADSSLPEQARALLIDATCSGVMEGYQGHIRAVLESEATPLPAVQRLGSVVGVSPRVDMDFLLAELLDIYAQPVEVFNTVATGALLITAWDITAESHTQDPLWEFHRHCRNAAAHGGQFNLLNGEPRREAKWRTLEIAHALAGTKLFVEAKKGGFIGPADALYLLSDIEKSLL